MVNQATADRLEKVLCHSFADKGLLTLSLTHSSVTESRLNSNERMEFLGDSVLGLIVCERIYELYPTLLEGEMTKIKSTAVSRKTCAIIAEQMKLHEMIVVGKGMQASGELPSSLSAAALEAVIAAVYLDSGIDAVKNFFLPWIDPPIIEAFKSGHQQNFKSVLQQHAQQVFSHAPVYRILDEKGPDHAKAFKIAVEIDGRRYDSSWGQSKKQAEQQAALNALQELGVIAEAEDGELRLVDQMESE